MIVRARHTDSCLVFAWAVQLAIPFTLAGRNYPAGTFLIDEGLTRVPLSPAAFADRWQPLKTRRGSWAYEPIGRSEAVA